MKLATNNKIYEKLYPMILILKLVSNETKKSRDKGEDWTLSGQHYPKYIYPEFTHREFYHDSLHGSS